MGCLRFALNGSAFKFFRSGDKAEPYAPISDFRAVPGASRQRRKLIQAYLLYRQRIQADMSKERISAWHNAKPHP